MKDRLRAHGLIPDEEEAAAKGRRYLTVDARQDTSMPILTKLGFVTIAYATAFNLPR